MTIVAMRVCQTEAQAQEAIVRIAAQLGIPERDISVTRCSEASYVNVANSVRDVALNALLVVGRRD